MRTGRALATTCAAAPASVASPVEDLQFSGAVAGRLTTGESATEPITSNPTPPITEDDRGRFVQAAPTATQCATFSVSGLPDDYVAVIVGSLGGPGGGSRLALTVEINTDNPAYVTPGTPLEPGNHNDGGSVELAADGGARRWQQVLSPDGEPPARVTLNPDRGSGAVDAWLGPADQSQLNAPPQVHVTGTWRCG